MTKIIEPCCYIKQLNNLIGEDGDVSFLYHNGDVLLQDVFVWMARRCCRYPGLRVTIAMPSISINFLSSIRSIAKDMAWCNSYNVDYPIFRSISVITRNTKSLEGYEDMFDVIAVTKNLSLQAITMSAGQGSGCRPLTLTGGMVQDYSPGLHLMVMTKTEEKYNLIQPILDSHLRLHKIN